jgi:hypothetical protein
MIGFHLAVAARVALHHAKLASAATTVPSLRCTELGLASPWAGSLLAATAAALNLGAGIVAATMSPAVTASVGERRSRNRQCCRTGRKHPNAHGKSPFNGRKRLHSVLVPPFIRAKG